MAINLQGVPAMHSVRGRTWKKASWTLLTGVVIFAVVSCKKAAPPAPQGPADYVKALLQARSKLAPIIDHGSSVELVRAPLAEAVGWRFTSERGMALTAVSVADAPAEVRFPGVRGTWRDAVHGNGFTAEGDTLVVPVPAHGVRLLHAATPTASG